MTIFFLVLILIALIVLIGTILVFNRLVRLRNQARTAWADIDVQLTRRHDLVPQLVAAVQGYIGHERSVLEGVAALRAQAMALKRNPELLGQVEAELQRGLGRLFALQEAYPDLKASGNFSQLQRDLVQVEETLQYARRFYNGAVRDYNDAAQRFPNVLVARGLGFRDAEFFQADEAQRGAVAVEMPK